MTAEKQYDWYVVRCFSGHEKKVKEYLEREMELQGLQEKIDEILIFGPRCTINARIP